VYVPVVGTFVVPTVTTLKITVNVVPGGRPEKRARPVSRTLGRYITPFALSLGSEYKYVESCHLSDTAVLDIFVASTIYPVPRVISTLVGIWNTAISIKAIHF
jgi:hypothetical protein